MRPSCATVRADDPLPIHRLEIAAPAALPFAIGTFDTIGPMSRARYPHRHTFHEIVYLTGGRGSHLIDLAAHPLRPPNLCVIVPGQVHSWERARQVRGRLILFTDEFLVAHPGDREALQELGERPWLRPTPGEARGLATVIRELDREYRDRGHGFVSLLQSYLHVLIVRARRIRAEPPTAPHRTSPRQPVPGLGLDHGLDRASAVAREFGRMLARPGDPARPVRGWSVRAFAALLGVSTGYLTEAVREVTGSTPGHLIRRARVLEAKRLLAGTDLTVVRVAREVGFADPAYFCRFFRRETGTSPGDYRRGGIDEKHHDPHITSIDPPGNRG